MFGNFPVLESSLPTRNIKYIYRDTDGFMWIASEKGVYRFDGYSITSYKSYLSTPGLLNNNFVTCIAEDKEDKIYIGTNNGLNIIDKRTYEITQSQTPFFNSNPISNIIVSRDNRVYVGTDRGFCQYLPQADSCITFYNHNDRRYDPPTTVKGLCEDSDGYIWIGSWNDGMSRFDPRSNTFVCYPRIGKHNSAHTIYEDSRKRLWIGTWGEGVVMIDNKFNTDSSRWNRFCPKTPNAILDSIIYTICEEPTTGDIWIGGRQGLSIIQTNQNDAYTIDIYTPSDRSEELPHNEVNAIQAAPDGTMWLGLLGGGVYWGRHDVSKFRTHLLNRDRGRLPTSRLTTIWGDPRSNNLHIGLFNYGFITTSSSDGRIVNNDINHPHAQNISSVYVSPTTGETWMCLYDDGISIFDKDFRFKRSFSDEPWLKCQTGLSVIESNGRYYWIGTRYGLYLYDATLDTGYPIQWDRLEKYSFVSMDKDALGRIWCASASGGIIRIDNPEKGQDTGLTFYDSGNSTLLTDNFHIIHVDMQGRVWAGSESFGLFLYDPEDDGFKSVNASINFPAEDINSIVEDKAGNLWLGTDCGLIKLVVPEQIDEGYYTLFTNSDGLYDNNLSSAAYYNRQTGEMYFGFQHGYLSFYPEQVSQSADNARVHVTNIRIEGTPWSELDRHIRETVSQKSPYYATHITLPHARKDLVLEIASLDVLHNRNKFLYKLEHFDDQWQHIDVGNNQIRYNNLPTGKYTLRIKRANTDSTQYPAPECNLEIEVLPPWWATWWANLCYMAITAILLWAGYVLIRRRIRLINRLRIQEIEKQQIEQMNQAKIRFFTNVSHEFLTPLTIISASIEEIRSENPSYREPFQVITNNVNRLMRLILQILEFRKFDTGNIKLKVAYGDIVQFVHNSFLNILPLMKRNGLSFTFSHSEESIMGWFDSDKLDKILYNLLSNAAKYNPAGGNVRLSIETVDGGSRVAITVADDGPGFSKEALESLFERFYDGDYRKYNTFGTGIGLSLSKNLAQLHGGDLVVDTDVEHGATLHLEIPIRKDAYNISEIDEEQPYEAAAPSSDPKSEEPASDSEEEDKMPVVLLVEDNPEMRNLTAGILRKQYRIHTAEDGLAALEVVKEHNVDLIISDVMMPNMDGLELTRNIKSNLDYCHIPIILLTVKSSENDRVEIYDSGADGYIAKPFSTNVLKAKIRNLLNARTRKARDFKKQYIFEAKELDFTSMDEAFIQKAITCVHENMGNFDFDQVQFVEKMAVSRSTLYRKIKSLTGMNPSAFIRNVRLKEACRIISSSPHVRISELAYAVGFSDPRYFSSCFKKEFGIQPKEYIGQTGSSHEADSAE